MKQLLQAKADLQKELESVKEDENQRREREEALREEIQTLTKKFQELEEIKRGDNGDPVKATPEAQGEPRPSDPASSPSQLHSRPDADPPSACSEGRQQAAARLLQARWRAYRRQKTKAALDEAAAVLQAAFRGHLARTKLLPGEVCGSASHSAPRRPTQLQDGPSPCLPSPIVQAEGDPGQEEAITVIQSVLQAHLARIRHRASPQSPTSAASSRRSAPAARSEPSSPPLPAASGEEDSEVSSGDTAEGPAPEDGDRALAAPQPCPAEPPPLGLQPEAPPQAEDGSSDDSHSHEVIEAPAPPAKKHSALP